MKMIMIIIMLSGEAAEPDGGCGGGCDTHSSASSAVHSLLASVPAVFHSDVPRRVGRPLTDRNHHPCRTRRQYCSRVTTMNKGRGKSKRGFV